MALLVLQAKNQQEVPQKDGRVVAHALHLIYSDSEPERKAQQQVLDLLAAWQQASKQFAKWTKLGSKIEDRLANDSKQATWQALLKEYAKVGKAAAALKNAKSEHAADVVEAIREMVANLPGDVQKSVDLWAQQWKQSVTSLRDRFGDIASDYHLTQSSWKKQISDAENLKEVLSLGSKLFESMEGDDVDDCAGKISEATAVLRESNTE